jgi:thymidylate kinase
MIIIEGPDDSGKTTLGQMIREAFDYTLIHSPGILKHEETFVERKFWYDALIKTKNIVLDRCFYISEFVYGPIIRNETKIERAEMKDYIRKVTQHFGIIIFMNQKFPSKNANESLHLSPEERVSIEAEVAKKYELIRQRYREIFNDMKYMSGVIQINKFSDYATAMSLIHNF